MVKGLNILNVSVKKLNRSVKILIDILENRDAYDPESDYTEDISKCENCQNKITMLGPSGDSSIIFKCKLTGKRVNPGDTCVSFKLDHLNL
jgi:hypothetical protein